VKACELLARTLGLRGFMPAALGSSAANSAAELSRAVSD
jgi:hypothetical protein